MQLPSSRHPLGSLALVLSLCVAIALLAGCESTQVANRTVNQSSYLPDLQYRQVIDNLAIIAENPSALPYFNPPNGSKTTMQRTAQTSVGVQWGLFAALQTLKTVGKTMITRTFEPLVVNQITPAFQGTQQNIDEWDTALSLDPVRSIVMQGLYRKVLGIPCTPFQLRLLQKFFYDYPNNEFHDGNMLFPDGLTPPYLLAQELSDRENSLKARIGAAINPNAKLEAAAAEATAKPTTATQPQNAREGAKTTTNLDPLPVGETKPKEVKLDPRQWSAFKTDQLDIMNLLAKLPTRTASQEATKQYAMCQARQVVVQCHNKSSIELQNAVKLAAVAMADLKQQVVVQRPIRERGDTYANYNAEFRELYHSLQPGWLSKGTKSDVPKNACYVGHHGKTYVWVTPDHLEQLTNLTVAILDAATAATGSTSLAINPISGGPPSFPTATGAGTGKGKEKEIEAAETTETAPSAFPPMLYAPAARDRFNLPAPPGPNVVPAPPGSGGMLR